MIFTIKFCVYDKYERIEKLICKYVEYIFITTAKFNGIYINKN
jgi:hypothetical protein